MKTELRTPVEVMNALGGFAEVAKLTGRGPTAPYNWREAFPSGTFAVIQDELEKRGLSAPRSLWNWAQADTERAAS
jgi:hypothetical protein